MLHGIAAPELYRSDGDWKWNNYTKPICEHVLDGEQELVGEYCKLDVLDTLLVFLVWLVHTGHLEEPQLREIVAVIRAGLRAEEFQGWAEIADGLEGWPGWD